MNAPFGSRILDDGRSPAEWCVALGSRGVAISERTLRQRARKLGACHVIGHAMIITPEQIDAILEDDERFAFYPDAAERWPWEAESRALAQPQPDRGYLSSLMPSGETSSVYFIRASSGHIKIGLAVLPETRLIELQIAHPLPLQLMATMAGNRAVERHLHRFFAAERVRGEWFEPSERLLTFIDRMAA